MGNAMTASPPANPNPNPNPEEPDATETVKVRIKGAVQHVHYRIWTMDAALRLGLDGWVRNRRDGSVEAVFSGEAAMVDSMMESCKIGPPAAVVTDVNVQHVALTVPHGFRIRRTAL